MLGRASDVKSDAVQAALQNADGQSQQFLGLGIQKARAHGGVMQGGEALAYATLDLAVLGKACAGVFEVGFQPLIPRGALLLSIWACNQTSISIGFSRYSTIAFSSSAPSAPSMTR